MLRGVLSKNRMISCTAEERETQSCSTGGRGAGFSFLIWTTHTRKEIHQDQSILVDDMNQVAVKGEGRMTAHGCRRTTDPGPQEKEGCPVPLGGGGGNHI